MRLLAPIVLILLVVPSLALGSTDVEDKVNQAIAALRTTCYEARMSFLNQYDENEVQKVRIFHVAPELYRVEPLVDGEPGSLYYIENAVELVRIINNYVEFMPMRRFATNDAMTIKFLRDLGSHGGTSVLKGVVGDYSYDVWILRQEATQAKPYTITVGLDQENFFPLFLLVTDGQGNQRVYYEMEAIEYHLATEIKDELFEIPEASNQNAAQNLTPNLGQLNQKQVAEAKVDYLPLYPAWLPGNYLLESISKMSYGGSTDDESAANLVFQLEAYGPRGELLSIFQTLAGDVDLEPDQFIQEPNKGYLVTRINGWMVVVRGDLPDEHLQRIAENLRADDEIISELLNQTKARDLVLHEAMEFVEN